MPSEQGCHGRLYWEIAISKPSVAMSSCGFSPVFAAMSFPRSRRFAALSPRKVSDVHFSYLPDCGRFSDSGLWWTIGPSKASPLERPV